jgi:hypothetical protein
MKYAHKLFAVASAAFFIALPAFAQNTGTVTANAFAVGQGAVKTGFASVLCTQAQIAIGQNAAKPICQSLTGDVTITAAGVTTIGANKVTNSQLNTMAANTTKCNSTGGTANPTDCTASTMRTNMGVVIGTNVEAWDNDLDCVAALSSTGVISRTGSGTCSAGALALSGLAAGTQDTVIGYFGSTTASAVAIANCTGALTYSTGTHTFGCNAAAGTGTVTSAQISAGANISVATTSGANPCTSTCNLTVAVKMDSAVLQSGVQNPTGTTNATGLMMGLGGTCKLTPTYSTRVKVEFQGYSFNPTVGAQQTIKLYYGTGTAPTNAAVTTGTLVGGPVTSSAPAANYATPFPISGVITGLTPGTAYWFDLNLGVNSGTGTVNGVSCNAFEVM